MEYKKYIIDGEPSICFVIRRLFDHSFEKQWYEKYFAFDIHGTITIPDYRKTDKSVIEFYPFAKETLQLISKRDDIKMIVSSSSYPDELDTYLKSFKKNDIHFDYLNENPEITHSKGSFGYYQKKYYFNVMFEDKAGFRPYDDWEAVYNLMLEYSDKLPDKKWHIKHKENYHKD